MRDAEDRRSDHRLVAPIVGRDRELASIRGLVERSAAGEGGTLLLEGPAGAGKTRLLEATIIAGERAGLTVVTAAADPLSGRRPFHLAVTLATAAGADHPSTAPPLTELLRSVEARSEPVALAPPGFARVAVIEAFVAQFEDLATGPCLLAVEDLHWADDASVAALRALLPLTIDLPLLLAVTTRPGERSAATDTFARELGEQGTVHRLDDLAPADALMLTRLLLEAEAGPRLTQFVGRVGGNPFLCTELVGELERHGRLQHDGRVVELRPDGSEVEVLAMSAIGGRLGAAGPDLIDLLRAGAVLGPTFSLRDAGALTGRPAAEFARAATDGIELGLVVASGADLRFRHELLRERVYVDMPGPVRAALHGDAARLLAERGVPPVAVATHAALGAAPDEAVRWLRSAAADIVSLSPADALAMLDEALALGTDDPAVLLAVQRARVDALMGVGRLEEAAALADRLGSAVDDGDRRAELLIRLAGILVLLNRTGAAVSHLVRAADEATTPGPRALALAQQALARMTQGDLTGAAAVARDAAALAEATGHPAARTIAASTLGRLPCFNHGYADGLTVALTGVEGADADPTGRAHDSVPWFWVGVIALDLDDFDLVDRAVREGRRRADEGYASWAHPLYCGLAASAHHRRGDLDECRAEATSGISLSIDTGSTQAKLWCESLLALVAHLEGDDTERAHFVAEAEATWRATHALLGIDHFALAQSLAMTSEKALEHLAGAWDLFESMANRNCQPVLAVALARAAAGRDPRRSAEVTGALATAARRTGLDSLTALEHHARGITDGCVDRLEQAAATFGRLGRALDAAEALADAARVAAAHHDGGAQALLEAAIRAFESVGAVGAAGRLSAEVGSTPAQPARAAVTGWDSLTDTERAVAAMVGRAMTNSQIAEARFVSRRTVESHLRRIYAKLGYSSRTRLALEAGERPER